MYLQDSRLKGSHLDLGGIILSPVLLIQGNDGHQLGDILCQHFVNSVQQLLVHGVELGEVVVGQLLLHLLDLGEVAWTYLVLSL